MGGGLLGAVLWHGRQSGSESLGPTESALSRVPPFAYALRDRQREVRSLKINKSFISHRFLSCFRILLVHQTNEEVVNSRLPLSRDLAVELCALIAQVGISYHSCRFTLYFILVVFQYYIA